MVPPVRTGPNPYSLGTSMESYSTKCYALSMRRVYRTRTFTRWMRKSGLSDNALLEAVAEMADGLIDADLGGNLVKKRIPLPGRGKSGGTRTIVATKFKAHWFFIYGFNKNERTNIDQSELKFLREVGQELLALGDQQISRALSANEITEIFYDNEKT